MCSGFQKLFNRECNTKWNENVPILNTNKSSSRFSDQSYDYSNNGHYCNHRDGCTNSCNRSCNGGCNNGCNNNDRINRCSCSHSCCQHDQCNHDNRSSVPVDAATTVNNFLIEYYRNVTNTGWNACLYLFDKNCVAFCKNTHVGNGTDMMNALATESVRRANFSDVRSKWMAIDANTVLISVYGRIQFVGYNERHGSIVPFAETFVLNATNGVVKCTHHLLDW